MLEEEDKMSYEDRMETGVPKDDAVSHRHFLEKVIPLKKDLENLGRWGHFKAVFSEEEQKRYYDFIRLLGRKMVPMALVKVDTTEEDDHHDRMMAMMRSRKREE